LKFHQSRQAGINTFTGYGDGFVLVNGRRVERSIIVMPDALIEDWSATTFDALTAADLALLTELDNEVVLLGTGPALRFPRPELIRPIAAKLAQSRAGLEVMDVQAACRTYSILVAEGRKVAAALLMV
jgi:uncharacterized protein